MTKQTLKTELRLPFNLSVYAFVYYSNVCVSEPTVTFIYIPLRYSFLIEYSMYLQFRKKISSDFQREVRRQDGEGPSHRH